LKILGSLYFHPNFFRIGGGFIAAWVAAYILPFLFVPVALLSWAYLLILLGELYFLFRKSALVEAQRSVSERLSNGDLNPVQIVVENRLAIRAQIQLIDEVPDQFQWRGQSFSFSLEAGQQHQINYQLRPQKRGPYNFGKMHCYASVLSHSLQRNFQQEAEKACKTYPSFLDLHRYELMAFSEHLRFQGQKRVRQIAISQEFEKIDKYVEGDDYRRINWKATARTGELMVNHYRDERSQNVVAAIDKGRAMKMPFGGLTLLDHAINASLMIANVALKKGDRVGLVTAQHKIQGEVLPSGRNAQMMHIMERLYAEKTAYKETDYSALYRWCSYRLKERSLVMLYTNFETLHGLHRQLPYLKLINRHHRLLVIFFLNEEIEDLSFEAAQNLQEVYRKGLAEDFLLEKQRIAKTLRRHGIQTLLTRPEHLNIKALNKYLEIKHRGLI
jgi:uncharacterized protein (DUF58 family)